MSLISNVKSDSSEDEYNLKIRWTCSQCDKNACQCETEVQLNDKGIYKAKCNGGHSMVAIMNQPKFVTLIDMGIFALLDGYPREAATNIAAALERFYEFCIYVIAQKNGMSQELFVDTWKLTKLTERQYGVFCFLYALEFKKSPQKLRKWTEFRNNITHNGYIPSFEEVINETEQVWQFIGDTFYELVLSYPQIVADAFVLNQKSYYQNNKNETDAIQNIVPIGTLTSYKFHINDVQKWEDTTFRKLVDEIKNSDMRQWFSLSCK